MSMMVSFVLSFFPRDVLDEILNLIESVSEDFPSYSLKPSLLLFFFFFFWLLFFMYSLPLASQEAYILEIICLIFYEFQTK